MKTPITPRRTYFFVYLVLLALLGATAGAAFVDLGPLNVTISLGIAGAKALLVMLFFMHVLKSDGLTRVFVGAGFIWLAMLIALTLTDYLTRGP